MLIVDEAHNMTGNEYGLALTELIKKSKNLRVVLLSATPMKNLASDLVELLNYIRPLNSKIQKEKIFNTSRYGYLLDTKEGGIDYLKKYLNGYISYYRGSHPLLFAKQVDMGEVPKELKFTKIIKCKMINFQNSFYKKTLKDKKDDTLENQLVLLICFSV